ncbi:MAG: molybdopterin-dependent oxidoreductase, partial [Gammaproteobacteria bacterium]|nr:molybdopterin-dependent oxidoreductase [Gammaproteobacteria bacterium]
MQSIAENDLGTPERRSQQQVTLQIDGCEVTVPAGTSVMRAAALADMKIPKLCATDQLEAFGSCRLCLVQIEGMKGYPASCTTPVAQGMKVTTQNGELARLRRGVMELYISDHPLDCLTCPANGHCELQDMAGAVGLREVRYGYAGANHLDASKDESNPYFTFDASKCIVCSRCVRACDEQQGTLALTISGRGFDSKVVASQGESFLDSECVSCGACVQACPTATLSEKSLIEQGQAEHSVVTTCAYCGVGCSFRAEMRGEELVRMVPNKDGHANHGHSCVKGRFAIGYATHPDRITRPMIRASITDPWREVGWEEAIGHAAAELRRIQARYGRDSIGGITSSRCTNEETFLVQKLVRAGFGNNNVDTCARVCHSPTGYGLKSTLGESAGTQTFDSVMDADVIMVIGANPTDAHPVFASQMKRRLRQGAQLIIADPRRIDLVRTPHITAAQHLALRPGTNVALINSLAHVVVREGLVKEAFVRERCEADSFEKWRKFVGADRNSPEAMAAVTGVPAEQVRAAARLYATAGNGAIYYGLGVTEHSQGSTMVMGIANLAMATGNVGREGVGINPLRGQNNVQGGGDMGAIPARLPGFQDVENEEVHDKFAKAWDGAEFPRKKGWHLSEMFEAMDHGQLRALYIVGENPARSEADQERAVRLLSGLRHLVVQDIFLTETAELADVVLPAAAGWAESEGTVTNSERRVQRVRRALDQPDGARDDVEIIGELARRLG